MGCMEWALIDLINPVADTLLVPRISSCSRSRQFLAMFSRSASDTDLEYVQHHIIIIRRNMRLVCNDEPYRNDVRKSFFSFLHPWPNRRSVQSMWREMEWLYIAYNTYNYMYNQVARTSVTIMVSRTAAVVAS